MNKYKWLLGLMFINLIGISLQASTIPFNSFRGRSDFELEDSAMPSLTYDGLLDLMLKGLYKNENSTAYSKTDKSLFTVLFQGKLLAHPHNFQKWKEMRASGGVPFLMYLNPAENLRRVWFFGKVFHTGSWANHCHQLDIPANASVDSLKEMLKATLKLGNSISLHDIKLFSSYENDTELNEADLQNDSILAQGITFSFKSVEKEIAIQLVNAPAAIQESYPQGLPFTLKHYYTTENDVRSHVAKLLNINSDISSCDVHLNNHTEPFEASLSFNKIDLRFMNIKYNINVLEVGEDGHIKSSRLKHHDLLVLNRELTLFKYIKNKLESNGKDPAGRIAIVLNPSGKIELQESDPDSITVIDALGGPRFQKYDPALGQYPNSVQNLEILVVPQNWRKVSVSFIECDNFGFKNIKITENYWLPATEFGLWKTALAYQMPPALLTKIYQSAQYQKEGEDFDGRKVFGDLENPNLNIKDGKIESFTIHMNPEYEKIYYQQKSNIERFLKKEIPLSLVPTIIYNLSLIDRDKFAGIHKHANLQIFNTLKAHLNKLDKDFNLGKGSHNNLKELHQIHSDFSTLVEQLLLVSDSRNENIKFTSIREKQAKTIQDLFNAQEDQEEKQQRGMNFQEYQNYISDMKACGHIHELQNDEFIKYISQSNLEAQEKELLINALYDA